MQLDDLLFRYFGTRSFDALTEGARLAGIEKMQVDLGLTRDANQKFGLWSVLYMLGAAPDFDTVFAEEAHRDAARNFMDLMAQAIAVTDL